MFLPQLSKAFRKSVAVVAILGISLSPAQVMAQRAIAAPEAPKKISKSAARAQAERQRAVAAEAQRQRDAARARAERQRLAQQQAYANQQAYAASQTAQPLISNTVPQTAPVARAVTGDVFEDSYTSGYRLWEAKLYPAARATLEEALTRFPNHKRASYVRTLLGRAWLDDKKPATAVRVFYENYKTDPRGDRTPDSLFFLGSALTDLGKTAEACEAFAELERAYPDAVTSRLVERVASGKTRAKCK